MTKKHRVIIDYFDIILGCLITSFAIAVFFNPAYLAPGGVSGVATIVYHISGIDLGLTMLTLSIPIYIVGILIFGKMYGVKTLVGTILLSVFTMFWDSIFGYQGILDYSKDMSFWLSALYGGVISGLGMGIVMRSGANTGGTDIIAQILAKYTKIPLGTSLMVIDGIIIIFSAFIFGIESALYSIIISFIVSVVIDKFIMALGTGYAKTVYIISDELESIGDFIINEMDRSGTILDATGLFTKKSKLMLMTVVPNKDIPRLTRAVKAIDSKAFLIIQETVHVLGEGYKNISEVAESSDVTTK